MKGLSLRPPVVLAVAEGATSPTGLLGAEIWSTTAAKKLVWNGTSWVSSMPAAAAGDVYGPASSVQYGAAVFGNTTGKLLADGGVLLRPSLQVLAADTPTLAANSIRELWSFDIPAGETWTIVGHGAYQINTTSVGVAIGFYIGSPQPERIAALFLYQNLGANTAATQLSDGDVFGKTSAPEDFYNTTVVSGYSLGANIGVRSTGIFRNTGASPLTVKFGISTVGTGVATMRAGSMALVTRH
jgi:hypothetical protein